MGFSLLIVFMNLSFSINLFTLFIAALGLALYFFIQNRRLKEQVIALTTLDEITGLQNSSATLQQVELLYNTAKRYKSPLSVAIIQFPNLSEFENYDAWLKKIASLLNETLRTTDALGRVSFDRFLFALTHTHNHDARAVIERLTIKLNQLEINQQHCPAFIGISQVTDDISEYKQLIKIAENSLNLAKSSATNQVQYAT